MLPLPLSILKLEQEARGPASVNAINVHVKDDETAKQAAIDRYGRDRIKSDDIVVWLLKLGGNSVAAMDPSECVRTALHKRRGTDVIEKRKPYAPWALNRSR